MHRLLIATIMSGAILVQAAALAEGATKPEMKAWYTKPAAKWIEALPIGNGRLGGMVFGGVSKEQIQFNEDSLWIGDETDTGAYQCFGDLFIEFADATEAEAYTRTLHHDTATHEVRYKQNGTTYQRTSFCSHPAQVLVVRLTADKKSALTGKVAVVDAHKAKLAYQENKITAKGSLDGYVYSGGSSRGRKEPYAIVLDYEAHVLVLNEGGTVKADADHIAFEGCDILTVLLVADTNYLNKRDRGWKDENPHARIAAQLDAAAKRPYKELLDEHVRDHQQLFSRCTLDVGTSEESVRNLPTDARIAAYKKGAKDPDLEELLFQHARYLIISSSRPGALPANLQGLWNSSNKPPWRSDYHTDVNVQMNYWFTGPTNLTECFEPLAEWVYSIRDVRRDETKKAFGTRGWLTHAENGPFGGSTWKWSKGDAAWVAQNLWDQYAFTQDKEYLRTRAFPIMKDLCEFWEDHLKKLPNGKLVSPDGFSPEHGPHEDGVSFDQQLIWDLFTNFIEASKALDEDKAYREKIAAMREQLLGPQIGKWGQLQEWMIDRDDQKDHHRHVSHMIAVYPGRQIAPRLMPEFAKAARVSLEARGHHGDVGWSNAWKTCLYARLHDREKAYWYANRWLANNTFGNLFNACWPGRTFQIDGNFGYAAGICEILLQSHTGEIELLPALPDAWPNGSIRGFRARGGFEVDMSWKDGTLSGAIIRSLNGNPCKLRYGDKTVTPEIVKGEAYEWKP